MNLRRRKVGLDTPLAALDQSVTFADLVDEFELYLSSLARSPKHISLTAQRLRTVAAGCRWFFVRDVTFASWVRWAGSQRGTVAAVGLSAETLNHYLRALRNFFNWLVKTNRLAADPLRAAEFFDVDADRRLIRRVLTAAEFQTLIESTRTSPKSRWGLDGPARAALYLVAARTGLRAGVLARLRPSDLRLDDPIPHIPVPARVQKNRKEHKVPLAEATVRDLRPWVAEQPAERLLWPGNWHRHNKAAELLRRDLAAAGIPLDTPDGTYDFHALRSQCGTDLALAGVPLTVAQKFLGHSTPTLTAKLYSRHGLADLADAANRLGLGSGLGLNPQQLPTTNPIEDPAAEPQEDRGKPKKNKKKRKK